MNWKDEQFLTRMQSRDLLELIRYNGILSKEKPVWIQCLMKNYKTNCNYFNSVYQQILSTYRWSVVKRNRTVQSKSGHQAVSSSRTVQSEKWTPALSSSRMVQSGSGNRKILYFSCNPLFNYVKSKITFQSIF